MKLTLRLFLLCSTLVPSATLACGGGIVRLPITEELPDYKQIPRLNGSYVTPKGLRVTFTKHEKDGHKHVDKYIGPQENCSETLTYEIKDTQNKDALVGTIVMWNQYSWSAESNECYSRRTRSGCGGTQLNTTEAAKSIPSRK